MKGDREPLPTPKRSKRGTRPAGTRGFPAAQEFTDLGFTHELPDDRELAFRRLVRTPGLYLLVFEDGSLYVGISKTLGLRLRSHWASGKAKGFLRVLVQKFAEPRASLLLRERELIGSLEARGFRVRNKDAASAPVALAGLALETLRWSPHDLERWQQNPSFAPLGERSDHSLLRTKNENTFRAFDTCPGREQALEALSAFLTGFLPLPFESEGSLWNLCFREKGRFLNFCFSVHRQEALTLTYDRKLAYWSSRLLITRSLVSKKQLSERFPNVLCRRHVYASAGHDQVTLYSSSLQSLLRLLSDPEVTLAGRDLVLRCMRKGPSQWARNHHPWVVDALIKCVYTSRLGRKEIA